MASSNFVPGQQYVGKAPGGGFNVVVGGKNVGNFPDLTQAENTYNTDVQGSQTAAQWPPSSTDNWQSTGLSSSKQQNALGGLDNIGSLLQSLGTQTMDPALLNYLQGYTNFYENTQWPQTFGLQAGQLSGYYNGQPTQTMQQQLWQQGQTGESDYINNLLGLSNATGMVGNQPTLQFQDLMNQAALGQENMGLQGRGQDLQALLGQLGYANNLQNTLGQYGTALGQQGVDLKGLESQYGLGQQQNQAQLAAALANAGVNLKGTEAQYGLGQQQNLGQFGLGLANVGAQQLGTEAQYGLGQQQNLGTYGAALGNQAQQQLQTQANYDIAQQQLQAQMAQSPLVAWYTARGLPPPAAAFQSAQNNPDFSNTLGQQQSAVSQALLNPTNPNFAQTAYGGQVGQVANQLLNSTNPNFQQTAFGNLVNQGAGQAFNPTNPNFQQTATGQQQQQFGNALLNQIGAPSSFQLNPMQQATMNWSQQPTNIRAQTAYTPPSPVDATNIWGGLVRQMQASGNVHLSQPRFMDMMNQAGVPPTVAQTMWQMAAQQGLTPLSNVETFRALLAQASNLNNTTPGGPLGAVQIGSALPGNALPPAPTGYRMGQAI